jgi:hypothetical protein
LCLSIYGGDIKVTILILFIIFLTISCNKNDKNNLRLKQLEYKLKKSSVLLDKSKKELEQKDNKIQSLMEVLTTCKQSKIKYINQKSSDYEVIDSNALSNTENNNINDSVVKTTIKHKPISSKEKINFDYPKDIIGECKKSDINRVFHNLSPYFIKCFENNNIKRGFIGFSWIINEAGEVIKVNLIKNNIFNEKLSNCLEVIIKKGRYNSPKSGICTITYTFKL